MADTGAMGPRQESLLRQDSDKDGVPPTLQISRDQSHIYRINGKRVPGFTEIARAIGIIPDNAFYTEAGRAEGVALHEWAHFLALGGVPKSEPDERIAGRVSAFRAFLKESRFRFVGGEQMLYHPTLLYCGTPDLWGDISGRMTVIDLKRGGKLPWHPLQTAAYAELLRQSGVDIRARRCLYLHEDGSYRFDEHKDGADSGCWRAIVCAYHARSHYIRQEKSNA